MTIVKVCFPGLTIGDKVYAEGEIERNPSPELVELARKKVKQIHRDSGRLLRLARIIKTPLADDDYFDDDELEINSSSPKEEKEIIKEEDEEYFEDLQGEVAKNHLVKLAKDLGLKKATASALTRKQLKSFIVFMRKL